MQLKYTILPASTGSKEISAVAFSPDSRRYAAIDLNGTIKLFNTDTPQMLQSFTVSPGYRGRLLAFSPDGQSLASESPPGDHSLTNVQLWDLKSLQPTTAFKGGLTAPASFVAFSPDGQTLVAYSEISANYNNMALWNTATGKLIARLPGLGGGRCFVFSRDSQLFSNGATVWETLSGKKRADFGSTGWGIPLNFSPDNKSITIWTGEKLNTWEIAGQRLLSTVPGLSNANSTTGYGLSSNNRYLINATNSYLQIWDLTTYQEVFRTPAGQNDGLNAMAVSADGKYLVSAYLNGSIKLWELIV